MKNRIISAVLSMLMLSCTVLSAIPSVLAQNDIITISSEDDFIEFAKNCTLDTWSRNKSVELTCDIDFKNTEFAPVPTFGGMFNGNGYTVSGIKFSENGSYIGVFRYIQQSGKIKNLNIEAKFIPNGSKNFIGGIVGENNGSLEMCNFEGTVKGQNVIGGIVGYNADTGRIVSCTSSGSIIGENSTGGIAGKNSGFIQDCTNNAAVNTVYEEKKNDVLNIETDTGAIFENYKNISEENEEKTILGHSDTGGIVGHSTGIVQGCTNNADIGYQHIGYNIGGIAGRQSGYMLGCRNYGFILGRKDVGGILGQIEPYILLNASESGLENIRRELDNLNTMVNRFITDSDNLYADTEKNLSDISDAASIASDNAEILINQGTDFLDDNLGEINAQAAILSNTLDKMTSVFESLERSGTNIGDALDNLKITLDEIKITSPELSNEIDSLKMALDNISNAENSLDSALKNASWAISDLDSGISFNSVRQVKDAWENLTNSIDAIIIAKQTIKSSLETIENIIVSKPESFEVIGINIEMVVEQIKAINGNFVTIISSLKTIRESFDIIVINTDIDFFEFRNAARYTVNALEHLRDTNKILSGGLSGLGEALYATYEGAEDYANDIDEELQNSKDNLKKSIDSLSYAVDDITESIGDLNEIITDLSNEETLEFVKLDDDFKAASENLFDSLSDISGKIDQLRNTVSNGNIINNVTAISNQLKAVTDLLVSEFENFEDGTESISDIFLDVSDEDIENTKQGKVEECHNYGDVEADRNAGGIAGAMAIEYAKDPEDDIEKPHTLNFTYRTKAILQDCINEGEIKSKKDCTGGVVGLSEIGTVYQCQNYADIESTNGNYVGGIAGKSDATIRKSFAKGNLIGKRYIGGIAGKADIAMADYAIVNITGDENKGAVCGDVESRDNLYQNFFVDNGIGAIDGVSYNEKAMPITFDELSTVSFIPERFISFKVAFIADDKVIETQDIKYGSETAKIIYPQIPSKQGQFGTWQTINEEKVMGDIEVLCEYKPYITILSSVEKDDKLSLALAEGEFTDKAELHITNSSQKVPNSIKGNTKIYDISIMNTDIKTDDEVTLRILNKNKDKVSAWILENGSLKEIKTASRGKYVILKATGTQNTICLMYQKRDFSILLIVVGIIIILSAVFICLKKKRKKTKLNNKIDCKN